MLVQTGLWVVFLVKLVKLVKRFGPIVLFPPNALRMSCTMETSLIKIGRAVNSPYFR